MRLELTGRTDLAIRVLQDLAGRPERACKGADLASAVGTTTNYLPQVMAPLLAAGWISSATGPSGGYRLETDLDHVSLLDVIEAVEGAVEDDKCVITGAPCPGQGPCALHDPWSRARGSLLSELGGTPVSHLRSRAPHKEGTHAN